MISLSACRDTAWTRRRTRRFGISTRFRAVSRFSFSTRIWSRIIKIRWTIIRRRDGYRERYAGRWIPPDLAALGGSTHQHLAGYYGMVKRLDEALGRLLDALKSLGILENTILLFTSDHGCHFKTRNGEYKRSCHESSIRVPTALHGPGFHGGGRLPQLVSLIDLPPTLLDAAGLSVPEAMQGRSILPLLRGEAEAAESWPEEMFVQISEAQVGRAVRTHRWKYGVDAPTRAAAETLAPTGMLSSICTIWTPIRMS